MAALLHCIVVEVENSRWKDHIRDWNTNMKVDMYDKMKKKIEELEDTRYTMLNSLFECSPHIGLCERCSCFMYEDDLKQSLNLFYYCESCISENPDLEFSDED